MTKVKICGVKTPEAVKAAVQSGADFVGFVFAKRKRQISLMEAHRLAHWVPAYVRKVGVFVSPSLEELQEAIKTVPLDMVQIHGDFDNHLGTELPVPVIRAVQMTEDTCEIETGLEYVLLDAPVAGSGQTFDWSKLDNVNLESPFFMAGGLTIDNVKEAIQRFKPFAVDVSSGVETNGVKDIQKIKQFTEKVKYDL
ncbi:phosphoribosylanthranilate isomerase [Streptococcus moroccensis]|uniref:N-(5'-phosphoribosyl)anthranilate isomerase n=1 Tax=Streptococcus moroccensis TaxID=1451356 RepID=A0ABT9YQJ5_9STRE|nr:phosphoribosylanthranilate isomerase [Streptococcus moroccensis]MDQ0222269.1 phosphoribosylanthranilate isomerase [Streptococcus moroccensis]